MKTSTPFQDEVSELLAKMTLEEKIGQMNQLTGFWDVTGPVRSPKLKAKKYNQIREGKVGSMLNVTGVEQTKKLQRIAVEESRLGIPLMFGLDVIHGFKTLSPIPLAEAASWDMHMIQTSARFAAREASAAGVHWTFAPMVDISRDPRWGRVMEGGGEDPYLGSKIAAARVKGFQGDNLGDPHTIAACAKHFAAYGFAEAGRDYNTVDIGMTTLYNVVLPPFKAAVDAGVKTFMNAFNILNGIPATGNALLQRTILKDKWGFDGFIVSDWDSIGEMVVHGFAEDGHQAAKQALEAGSDMDMESLLYKKALKKLVVSGKVDVSLIDDAVSRILTVKHELGLFQNPYRYCDIEREKTYLYHDENQDFVRILAERSIVLLKNENALLPLKKEKQRIAVIGPLANDCNSPLGSWRISSENFTAVSLLEGLVSFRGNEWIYQKGVELITEHTPWTLELKINDTDRTGIPEAIEAAREADIVIMAIGEHGFHTAEGRSRTKLDIPGLQQELLESVYEVNKNIVLVLFSGRPLTIPWAAEHIPAIVMAWQLGTESGQAIANVLMGDYNPSGKLPMTFPRSIGQVPIYYNHLNTGRPHHDPRGKDIVFWSHYIDERNDPLYPFGFGLSYSTFAYSYLRVKVIHTRQLNVLVDVENLSDMDGEEVIQLYIRDIVASVVRPVKELKGFDKQLIKAGEKKTITFSLGEEELGFFDQEGTFKFEPGVFQIMVGGSSDNTLKTEIQVN